MNDQNDIPTASPPSPPSPASSARPRRRLWRWLVGVVAVIIIVLLVLLAFAPSIAAGLGKGRLVAAINESVHGEVTVDSINLSWFGGQSVTGFVLRGPDGNTIVSIGSLEAEPSLWQLITGDLALGVIELRNLEANIVRRESGETNVTEAVAAKPEQPEPSAEPAGPFAGLPADLALTFRIVDGRVSYREAGRDEATVNERFDAFFELVPDDAGHRIEVSVDSEQMVRARLAGQLTPTRFKLSDPAELRVMLPEALVGQLLAAAGEASPAIGTTGPVSFEANLETLNVPLGKSAASGLAIDAGFSISDGAVSGGEQLGRIAWSGVQGRVETSDLARRLSASIEGETQHTVAGQTHDGRIDIRADLENLLADRGSAAAFGEVTGSARATISGLPLVLADRLAKQDGMLVAALGDRLELDARAETRGGGTLRMTLAARADYLDARFAGDVKLPTGDAAGASAAPPAYPFTATEAGQVTLTVTPGLVDFVMRDVDEAYRMSLSAPVQATVTLRSLSTHLGGFAPADTRAEIELAVQDGEMVGSDEIGRFAWRGVRGGADSDELAERLTVNFGGQTTHTRAGETLDGRLDLDATVERLFTAAGELRLNEARADGTVAVAGLPVAVADALSRQDGLLVAALGERLAATLTARTTGPDSFELSLDLDAPRLDADTVRLTVADRVRMPEAATFTWSLQPELLERFAAAGEGEAPPMRLTQPTHIALTLKRFTTRRPQPGGSGFVPSYTQLAADLRGEPIVLANVGNVGTVRIDQLTGTIIGEPLSSTTLDVNLRLAETDDAPGILAAIGDAVGVAFTATAEWLDEPRLSTSTLAVRSLDAAGEPTDALDVEALLAMGPGLKTVKLVSPLEARMTLTPGLMRAVGATAEGGYALAGDAPITLTVQPVELPVSPLSFAGRQIEAEAKIDELLVAGGEAFDAAGLREAVATVTFDGDDGDVRFQLTGQTIAGEADPPGGVSVDAMLSNVLDAEGGFDMTAASLRARRIRLTRLPVAFVEMLAGQPGKLTPMVGEVVSVTAEADLPRLRPPQGTASVKIESGAAKIADAALRFDEMIELTAPATLKVTITPEAYAALTAAEEEGRKPAVELAEPVQIAARIGKLRWPMPTGGEEAGEGEAPAAFDPAAVVLEAELTASRLAFRDVATQHTVAIEGLKVTAAADNLAEPIEATVTGRVPATGDQPAGQIDLAARLHDAFAEDGAFQSDAMGVYADGTLQAMPVTPFDELMQLDGLATAVLGGTTDVKLTVDIAERSGPLAMTLTSPNAKVVIDGRVDAGVLTLAQPMTAELTVTPELGRRVLRNLNPILASAQSGEQPARLTVAADDFSAAVMPYDPAKLNVPSLTLELGTLTVKNDYVMKAILTGLKLAGGLGDRATDEIEMYFTPVYAHIDQGVLTYDRRTDAWISRGFHMSMWGEIDLPDQYVNMVVALPSDTLDDTFGVDDVKAGTMAAMPLQGPLSKPKLDVASALADIVALKAGKTEGMEGALIRGGTKLGAKLLEGLFAGDDDKQDQSPVERRAMPEMPQGPKAEDLPGAGAVPDGQLESGAGEDATAVPDSRLAEDDAEAESPDEQPEETEKRDPEKRLIEEGAKLLEGLLK